MKGVRILIAIALIIVGFLFFNLLTKTIKYNRLASLEEMYLSDNPDIAGLISKLSPNGVSGIYSPQEFQKFKEASVWIDPNFNSYPIIGFVTKRGSNNFNDIAVFDKEQNEIDRLTLTGRQLTLPFQFDMIMKDVLLVMDTDNNSNRILERFNFSTKDFIDNYTIGRTGQIFIFPNPNGNEGVVIYGTGPESLGGDQSTWVVRLYSSDYPQGKNVGEINERFAVANSFYWQDEKTLYFLGGRGRFWKLSIK